MDSVVKSPTEFLNDAIADLVSKRKKRFLAEKQIKNEPFNAAIENCDASPYKKMKLECMTETDLQNAPPNFMFMPDLKPQFSTTDVISRLSSSPTNESTSSSDNITDESASQSEFFEQLMNSIDKPLARLDGEFTNVTGRLSLMNVCKYKVTVGELARRVNGPECFSFSLLGGLLRRAKMPNNTNLLKCELEAAGMSIPRGRRRGQLTLFSSMLEEESLILARDFSSLTENTFPTDYIAAKVLKDSISTGQIPKLDELAAMKRMINQFSRILEKDSSVVGDRKTPDMGQNLLEPELQEPLTKFSMLTHGFGAPAIQTVMRMFESFIDAQICVMKV